MLAVIGARVTLDRVEEEHEEHTILVYFKYYYKVF